MTEYMELFDSSSDEDDLIVIPPLPPIIVPGDDEDENLLMLHPVFGILQKIEHYRILNYIETIVVNYNEADFIMHFRLLRQIAYTLIGQFQTSQIFTSMENVAGRSKISAEKHILSYLWFIGHQSSSYRNVADRFGVTLSCLHNIISRVTDFIMILAPNIIKYPTEAEKKETASFYEQGKGFPGVIGAIDGSHIRIDRPTEDPDSYVNRKQYFSIHIQGVANHKMKFIDVFIGYPGSVHDARVFRHSPVHDDLNALCGNNYHILGDSAYPCLKQLLVPYKDNGHLTRAQKAYNTKLSSCRIVIENAFRRLKQRFRQLYHFRSRDVTRMVQIIHACCVLHNLASIDDLQYFEEDVDDEYPDNIAQCRYDENNDAVREVENGKQKRDEICELICT